MKQQNMMKKIESFHRKPYDVAELWSKHGRLFFNVGGNKTVPHASAKIKIVL